MGTPSFALPALRAVAGTCEVPLVVTQPDRPRGRGREVVASEVARAAEELGLEVAKPETLEHAATREQLTQLAPDLFAVVAYGGILSRTMLALPKLGCINLHGSLLPRYRGASPVQRALWDGEPGTGVTTMWIDEGIDTGDLILQRWTPIDPEDDAASLAARLADLGGPLLAESLLLAHAGRAPRHPQDRARATYAKKLAKTDGLVNWALDATVVWNHLRAMTPWPGATAMHRGKRLLVTRAWPHHLLPASADPGTVLTITADGVAVACQPGVLWLSRVKAEGRDEMDAAAWARGVRLEPGESLAVTKEAHA